MHRWVSHSIYLCFSSILVFATLTSFSSIRHSVYLYFSHFHSCLCNSCFLFYLPVNLFICFSHFYSLLVTIAFFLLICHSVYLCFSHFHSCLCDTLLFFNFFVIPLFTYVYVIHIFDLCVYVFHILGLCFSYSYSWLLCL